MEALSVMDVNAITASGNAAILAQELRASILMSALVRQKICPNHVETFGVLRTKHAPRDIWGCPGEVFTKYVDRAREGGREGGREGSAPPSPPIHPKAPTRAALSHGDFQLIRMELCRHGDLEGFLRRQPEGVLPPALTRLLLFQMCFALYAARDTHLMRHYDLKLLNFLLADFPAPGPSTSSSLASSSSSLSKGVRSQRRVLRARQDGGRGGGEGEMEYDHNEEEETAPSTRVNKGGRRRMGGQKEEEEEKEKEEVVTVRYGLGAHTYLLPLPASLPLCVKLADFGTADLSAETWGQPIGLEQFTTLENTPVDFLVNGDQAQQGFAADAFSLGLAVWHLFTGSMPYEEVMENVRCPPSLRRALAKAWGGKGYWVLGRVLDAGGEGGEEEEEEVDLTLFHTFYRYLVLLGLPSEEEQQQGPRSRGRNPVWKAVASLVGPNPTIAAATATAAGEAAFLSSSFIKPLTMSTRKRAVRATTASSNSSSRSGSGSGVSPAPLSLKERVTHQFWQDHAAFSITRGTHPLVARGRERLHAVPGALPLLRSLLHYLPEKRPTMFQALSSEVFACLREEDEGEVGREKGEYFSAYFRGRRMRGGKLNMRSAVPLREDI